MIEALPLADLGAQAQCGQRVDPAQASEPCDRVRARDTERELRELGFDLVEAELAKLAVTAPCADTVARLRCLRGIDTLSALGRRDRRVEPL